MQFKVLSLRKNIRQYSKPQTSELEILGGFIAPVSQAIFNKVVCHNGASLNGYFIENPDNYITVGDDQGEVIFEPLQIGNNNFGDNIYQF